MTDDKETIKTFNSIFHKILSHAGQLDLLSDVGRQIDFFVVQILKTQGKNVLILLW